VRGKGKEADDRELGEERMLKGRMVESWEKKRILLTRMET
jgi:hypothetical protein